MAHVVPMPRVRVLPLLDFVGEMVMTAVEALFATCAGVGFAYAALMLGAALGNLAGQAWCALRRWRWRRRLGGHWQ